MKGFIISDELLRRYEGLFFLDEDALMEFKRVRDNPAPDCDECKYHKPCGKCSR